MRLAVVLGLVIAGPLRVHPRNPRYLTDDGQRAVYLTGSHVWYDFQDGGTSEPLPVFDNRKFLADAVVRGQSFVRLWTWESTSWIYFVDRVNRTLGPMAFRRTGPGVARDGKPKFDLTQPDPAYFNRLRGRVRALSERGIHAGVMLFQGFSVAYKADGRNRPRASPWDGHPLCRDNNVNGIDGDLDGSGEGYEVHTLSSPAVTRIQEDYVRRTLDALNDFDNVVYEICNECHGSSTAWQEHFVRFIRSHEATKPRQHPVWMSFQWDGFDRGQNASLFAGPAEIVSPASHDQKEYATDPPAADGGKVVILDTDHINPFDTDRAVWVWQSFVRGNHPIYMDDPTGTVDRRWTEAGPARTRAAMGQTLRMTRQIDLGAAVPVTDADRCSSRHCLVDRGRDYVALLPAGGQLGLHLEPGKYRCEWLQPGAERVTPGGVRDVQHAGLLTFTPPFPGPAVMHAHLISRDVARR